MRVVILGAGAVGAVIAEQLTKSKHIDKVTLADLDLRKARALRHRLGSPKVVARKADASKVSELAKLLKGSDIVVNATIPKFNLSVMRAALRAKVHYMDLATGGPRELVGSPDIDEQLALGERFKNAGLTALLSMGVDPGCTNIFARYMANRMECVEEVLIRDGDNSTVDGHFFAPLFSPDTIIEECLLPPLVYREGQFIRMEPMSGGEVYNFPQPLGPLTTYYVDHEEVETIPANIPGVKRCDFKYALGDSFIQTLKALHAIGMTRSSPTNVGDLTVIPKSVLVSLLPDPSTLGPKVKGHSCVGVEVRGRAAGRPKRTFMYTMSSHEECYKNHGVTATAFQTGVPPAIAVEMIARGTIARRGAFTAEMLDPEPWPEELRRRGMPVEIVDLPEGSDAGPPSAM